MHTLLEIGICVLLTLLELAVLLVFCAPRWCWQHLRALLRNPHEQPRHARVAPREAQRFRGARVRLPSRNSRERGARMWTAWLWGFRRGMGGFVGGPSAAAHRSLHAVCARRLLGVGREGGELRVSPAGLASWRSRSVKASMISGAS